MRLTIAKCEQKIKELEHANAAYKLTLKDLSLADQIKEIKAERDDLKAYASNLEAGYPEGLTPTDVRNLRTANDGLAAELSEQSTARIGAEYTIDMMCDALGLPQDQPNGPELIAALEAVRGERDGFGAKYTKEYNIAQEALVERNDYKAACDVHASRNASLEDECAVIQRDRDVFRTALETITYNRCDPCDRYNVASEALAAEVSELGAERDALGAEVERLQHALKRYGQHDPLCHTLSKWISDEEKVCTCGLDDAKEGIAT